jgi:hypothetical protein
LYDTSVVGVLGRSSCSTLPSVGVDDTAAALCRASRKESDLLPGLRGSSLAASGDDERSTELSRPASVCGAASAATPIRQRENDVRAELALTTVELPDVSRSRRFGLVALLRKARSELRDVLRSCGAKEEAEDSAWLSAPLVLPVVLGEHGACDAWAAMGLRGF